MNLSGTAFVPFRRRQGCASPSVMPPGTVQRPFPQRSTLESIMHGCEGCRDNLLDYLYDLLDEAEARELRAHLDGCPACQRALEQARAQQKLLAAAARVSFPDVTFAPPPAEQITPAPAAGVRTVLLPVKPRVRKPVRWGRWAAAAAVLLAFVGLGVTAGMAGRDYAAADAVVKAKEE